jgi:anti-sigma regulatory factor (Ser/Thr protein kinase)
MPAIQESRRGEVFTCVSARAGSASTFHIRQRATPASIAIFRAQLRAWLEAASVHPGEVFDIVLACSECLSLVIEERQRQVALIVDVEGRIQTDELTVTTREYGLCHDSHTREQEQSLSLSLMWALMDSVDLQRHGDGQTITLCRRLRTTAGERRALLI